MKGTRTSYARSMEKFSAVVSDWTGSSGAFVLALGAIGTAIVLSPGGVANFKFFINMEAYLVVMGGTFCAIMVNYPWAQVWGLRKVLKKVLLTHGEGASRAWFEEQIRARYPRIKIIQPSPGQVMEV